MFGQTLKQVIQYHIVLMGFFYNWTLKFHLFLRTFPPNSQDVKLKKRLYNVKKLKAALWSANTRAQNNDKASYRQMETRPNKLFGVTADRISNMSVTNMFK